MSIPRLAVVTAALSCLAASAASACDTCLWGERGHPTGDGGFDALVDRFNSNLRPGELPIGRPSTAGGDVAALLPGGGTQSVWLDFSQAPAGVFSQAERQAVLDAMAATYAGFDVALSLDPPSGPATRISFIPTGSFGQTLGGVADSIDFRNVVADNTGFVYTQGLADRPSSQQVQYAANVGSHELGHVLGLRHHDSFGPIGSGVPSSSLAGDFLDGFPGPVAGQAEFDNNVMSTPAFGADGGAFFDGPANLSVRSAIKLAHAAEGQLETESSGANGTVADAQPLDLLRLDVPNTRPSGTAFAGEALPARAGALSGQLTFDGDRDLFSFEAAAGNVVSVEVISRAIDQRIANTIDSNVRVLDADGAPLDYYGAPASNDDEIETFDSWIFDLLIPDDGTYFVEVATSFNFPDFDPVGDYELFVTSFGDFFLDLLPGDANADGTVDLADFGILRSNFGLGPNAAFDEGDFDGDGLVDLADFGLLRANFGASADDLQLLESWVATIPEPASLAAVGLTALAGLRRPRS